MTEQEIAEQLEVFADYVRNKRLRMTRQRQLIVKTFLEEEGHLSTEELHNRVRAKDHRIGHATVFRTLKALTDCGLARETDLNDGRTRFEHLYKHPQHYHIVCEQCKRAIEFYSPELEELQSRIVAQYDFEPVRHRFQIFGICRDCRTRKVSPQETFEPDQVFARDALRIAIETEKRGVKFYRTAARIAAQPSTRKTFLKMLEDEEKHLADLLKEWNRLISKNKRVLDAPVFLHFDYKALKKIFPSREEISRKLNSDLSEEEALSLAMGMEKDAHVFFSEYAERFNDTKGRDIFMKFADEEQEHYIVIKAAYDDLQRAKES
jgi:Fur family ferric uptake transcriptional regulator